MRLIDADAFKERYKKNHSDCELTDVFDDIDAQPTAYDVDAVVEQIEALEDVGRSWTHKYILSNKAIEIVRKGGVNE